MTSTLISPIGILALAHLAHPMATREAQAELTDVWGDQWRTFDTDRRVLEWRGATALAAGAWTRAGDVTDLARTALGSSLHTLPDDDTGARKLLDAWARERTHGLVGRFPVEIDTATTSVLASVVAVDDTWAGATTPTIVAFGGDHPAFEHVAARDDVAGSGDGRAVRVVTRLVSGLEYVVVLSADGPDDATRRLRSDTWGRLTAEHPCVRVERRAAATDGVLVRQPSFRLETEVDLTGAGQWGLRRVCEPCHGLPGLHPGAHADQVAQGTTIEVTATGLRAASVTAATTTRALLVGDRRDVLVVEIDRPFAFEVRHPRVTTPLFTGTYAGDHPCAAASHASGPPHRPSSDEHSGL